MKAENDGGKIWLFAGTHGVHMMNAFQNQFLVVDFIAQKKIEK